MNSKLTVDHTDSVVSFVISSVGDLDQTIFDGLLKVKTLAHSDQEISLKANLGHQIKIFVNSVSAELSISLLICHLLPGFLAGLQLLSRFVVVLRVRKVRIGSSPSSWLSLGMLVELSVVFIAEIILSIFLITAFDSGLSVGASSLSVSLQNGQTLESLSFFQSQKDCKLT